MMISCEHENCLLGRHYLTKRFCELNRTPNATYKTYIKAIENENPEI
jgi:hypothetical protein